jgi:Tfp pilus assembly protein PilO
MNKTRQWSVFTAIAVVVVLLAGWFLLVKPQSSHASSLRTQAATQQASNQLLITQIATLQAEQKQLPQQQKELQKFATQVPTDVSEPTIIRQLSAAAAGAGVDLVSVTPGAPSLMTSASTTTTPGASTLTQSSAPLVQLPLALGITGTYANIESFFQLLEKLPRALLVTGWSLCPDSPNGTSGSSGVSCSLPVTPANKTLPPDAVGGSLAATIFYAPPAGSTPALTPSVTTPVAPTPTGTATATTTPAPSTSTAATTPATAASSAPAN